jgi:hypothetical protein
VFFRYGKPPDSPGDWSSPSPVPAPSPPVTRSRIRFRPPGSEGGAPRSLWGAGSGCRVSLPSKGHGGTTCADAVLLALVLRRNQRTRTGVQGVFAVVADLVLDVEVAGDQGGTRHLGVPTLLFFLGAGILDRGLVRVVPAHGGDEETFGGFGVEQVGCRSVVTRKLVLRLGCTGLTSTLVNALAPLPLTVVPTSQRTVSPVPGAIENFSPGCSWMSTTWLVAPD